MPDAITEWFDALRRGDVPAVERALAADPALALARHETGLSSVMWACYCRQQAVVAVLLARGPELDLFEAVAAGEEARARSLLAHDASLATAWSADGFTALHLAAFFSRPALAELLIALGADVAAVARNDARVQPLHSAAAAGDLAVARALLASGADPGARQAREFTPLMSAAQQGNDELAALLLEHGADPAACAGDGRAAADFADERNHHALAARLRGSSPGA
jgi:ankyrin repeat protein